MSPKSYDLHGVRVFECAVDGPALCSVQDAVAVIGEALGHEVSLVVIPVSRFDPDFFKLRSGLAGEILQKFVNYRLRLAIIGDLSEFAVKSAPFRDFIYEANQGNAVWFLANIGEVERRLASQESG